ncbi:YggT family protein [Actinoplanes campanulatus]|uniref:YggT family protein n=1 Tax=Actinoplanes campanulatus TaxID=113559 RepID=A0A7W5FFI7_9ACTN|nr:MULTISPECIES: YggT family protein [Actinoplanes]MBB3096549.1 YggT family protein [Actinoplanes campanulatus]GGN17465.1 YggT family protein [Actinoplanes campanulatus]GID38616.1 YggT family protein [Actinoplanes campanulatus]GID50265.1 YggT family protein [Actinoplanes capillaceus]
MGLLGLVSFALLLVQLVLVARVILDWSVTLAGPAVPGSFRSKALDVVYTITEPILAPVRRIIPPLRAGGVSIDLAFIVLFLGISVIRSFL